MAHAVSSLAEAMTKTPFFPQEEDGSSTIVMRRMCSLVKLLQQRLTGKTSSVHSKERNCGHVRLNMNSDYVQFSLHLYVTE